VKQILLQGVFPKILLLVIVFTFALKKQKRESDLEPLVPWNLFDILKILVVVVLVYFAFLLSFIYGHFLSTKISIFTSSITAGVILCLLLYFVINKYHLSIKRLGLTKKDLRANIYLGLQTALAWGLFILLCNFVTQIFSRSPTGIYSPREIAFFASSPYLYSFFIFLAITFVPFVEELFFRGITYPAFKKKVSVNWAMFLSALVWGLVHPLKTVWLIIILGLILVKLYERTKSLIPCLILHGGGSIVRFSLSGYAFSYQRGITTMSPLKLNLILIVLFIFGLVTLQKLAHRKRMVKLL